jgi:hypothetical protein
MDFLDFLNDIRRRAGLPPMKEGSDNTLFLMKTADARDDGLPPIYPLPTGSKKYNKKINKGFRGKKPKVRQLVKVKDGD